MTEGWKKYYWRPWRAHLARRYAKRRAGVIVRPGSRGRRRIPADRPDDRRPSRMSWLLRRICPEEALRLRALRLRALAETPSAFSSTFAQEAAFDERVWQERATHGAAGKDRVTYIAEEGPRWIGMATGLADDRDAPNTDLVGMFVAPSARGRGVGAALVEAVAEWARDRGAPRLLLWVTSTNAPALALYHRSGFRPTGKAKPLDHTSALTELEMVRDL